MLAWSNLSEYRVRGPCSITGKYEINHDDDVLVTTASIPPDMLVHALQGNFAKIFLL